MSGANYTSQSVPISEKNFNGGLNSASGPLSLQNNESTDLQNIDFNKFGSILKRNGYNALNTTAITSSPQSDGLYWYEFVTAGAYDSKLLNVADGKLYKMDSLNGTWNDVTGAITITAGKFCDFETFLSEAYVTNNYDLPFKWTGSGNAAVMTVPASLTKAKCVALFNNYLFLANCVVGGVTHKSRLCWSNIGDTNTWGSANFIDIARNDGQEIQRVITLGDRFVVFKTRSIYIVGFTGDNNIPFIVQKSASAVGCIAPFSVQELENGLVFLSHDGLYYFDGNNSYKISDRIQTTIDGFNQTRLSNARSMVKGKKNQYFCSFSSSSSNTNDRVLVWDFSLNAWSVYKGMACSSMSKVFVNGIEERIYFGDYSGFVYRADVGSDDYPLNTRTAISAYYYTNWKNFEDLVNQKGIGSVVIYHQITNAVLTFSYSYDFENADTYSQTLSLATSGSVYGVGLYGTATYAGTGGYQQRRDLAGRGRVVRFKFSNSNLGETFSVDGIGSYVHLETNVG